MNKIWIALIFSFAVYGSLMSQERQRDRIKAYKAAYITQELDLSSKEAEKFWPIYNAYQKKVFQYRVINTRKERDRIMSMGGPDALNEAEATLALANLIQNEKSMIDEKEMLYKNLKKVLPSGKLLKLYKAEMDFNKRLLSEFRKRGHSKGNK